MSCDRWNHLAETFEDEVCDITVNDSNRVMHRLITKVQQHSCGTLVDLGCGIGTFIRRFGSRFRNVIGVDYSQRILARAKEHCSKMPQVQWVCANMQKAVDLIGPTSDLTTCLNVITSSSGACRYSQWTAVRKITRPGGFVLVAVPSLESAKMIALNTNSRSARRRFARLDFGLVHSGDEFQKYYSEAELRNEMLRHRFIVRAVRRIRYPWAEEGLRLPRGTNCSDPWDWVCLAQLAAVVRNGTGNLQLRKGWGPTALAGMQGT